MKWLKVCWTRRRVVKWEKKNRVRRRMMRKRVKRVKRRCKRIKLRRERKRITRKKLSLKVMMMTASPS